MLYSSVFFDEITIWWDRFKNAKENYKIYLDAKLCDTINRTHYTFSSLESDREYSVEIKVLSDGEPTHTFSFRY